MTSRRPARLRTSTAAVTGARTPKTWPRAGRALPAAAPPPLAVPRAAILAPGPSGPVASTAPAGSRRVSGIELPPETELPRETEPPRETGRAAQGGVRAPPFRGPPVDLAWTRR